MSQCRKSVVCSIPDGFAGHRGRCNTEGALTCLCADPQPVKLGAFGAYECARCRRCIIVRDSDPTPAHGLERPLVMS